MQCTLPDKMHSEHTVGDAVSVYSHIRTTFSQTLTSEITLAEMAKLIRVDSQSVKLSVV